ncbi:MAG: PepSY domain-containing protein [Pseudomonas sp.]
MTGAVNSRPRAAAWRQWLLRLMPWHRRLAILACVGIFSWAGSGMLHPLMSYLQVRPATMAVPQQALPLDQLRAPAQVLAAAGIERLQGLRLLQVEGQPYYQARLPGADQPRYFHARDGVEVALQARHAEALAAHYLGSQEPVAFSGTQQQFSSEYAFINRLLPVVRVNTERDNGLRLYLDLYHDRLGTLVDDRKAWFSGFFQTFHSFAWLNWAGPLRPLLMLLLLASVVLATLIGLGLFFARRGGRRGWRRLHGWYGLGLALATLSFASSGAWHLLHKQMAEPYPASFVANFAASSLTVAPSADWALSGETLHQLSLIELDGRPVWRVQGNQFGLMDTLHYLDAHGGGMDDDTPSYYAAERLAFYADALGLGQGSPPRLQQRFDHDYGFVFKRLPVFWSDYPDAANTRLFIDPLDGALAARVQNADRREGWVFGYLHKWDWLGRWGSDFKHAAVGVLALLHLVLALLGLSLLRRRR